MTFGFQFLVQKWDSRTGTAFSQHREYHHDTPSHVDPAFYKDRCGIWPLLMMTVEKGKPSKRGKKSQRMYSYCVFHKNWTKYHTTGKKKGDF